jgi:phytoene desaturase
VIKNRTKAVGIIGSGFSGLAAACQLAKAGHQVTVLEKNNKIGGRGKSFHAEGFTFDMGPSWYWMPEVMDQFFESFGKKTSDYYTLHRLNPSYRVFLPETIEDIPSDYDALKQLFEKYEAGAGEQLSLFLKEAEEKYETGMGEFVWKPSHHIGEFFELKILKALFKIQLFTDMRSHLKKYFKNPILIQLLEFPVLFLGAKPSQTPALYSLMNYADLKLGTWYPMGGMSKVPEAMHALALELGVNFISSADVSQVELKNNQITKLIYDQGELPVDEVINSGDYHHFEQSVLPASHRVYSEKQWDKRTMSPSSLLFYVGLNKKIEGIEHHNLFFDCAFDAHAAEIYDQPAWPQHPLFYLCCPSKTDQSVAPEGQENLFFLIPVAPDMQSNEEIRNHYWNLLCDRLQERIGVDIRPHVVYKRSYAHEEFQSDYHSYKGNAYGLANTLMQTAFLKPKLKSSRINNLYYCGQLTVPGPGMPPGIISGQLAAREIIKKN